MNTVTMTFEERPILVKYKEGDNKDLGFWFIVTGCWLKEKNQKQQTRDRKPNLYSNRAKGGVMQRSRREIKVQPAAAGINRQTVSQKREDE